MPTVASGQIDFPNIQANLGRGYNLNAYRGTFYYVGGSMSTGNFSSGQIGFADFYNKQSTDPASSGAADYTSAGYYVFYAPLFRNSLTIQVWGGGGAGGGNSYGGTNSAGGTSVFYGPHSIIGYGGGGGQNAASDRYGSGPQFFIGGGVGGAGGAGGAGGSATGGTTNIGGNRGGNYVSSYAQAIYDYYGNIVGYYTVSGLIYEGGYGGSAANGGGNVGIQAGGTFPGGGGGGYAFFGKYTSVGGGGGGGGYSARSYGGGGLSAGAGYGLVVGAGGSGPTGGGGAGNRGRVYISWG